MDIGHIPISASLILRRKMPSKNIRIRQSDGKSNPEKDLPIDRINGETDREYEGISDIVTLIDRDNYSPSQSADAAKDKYICFLDSEKTATSSLHEFLVLVYKTYICARDSGNLDAVISAWCPKTMKGTNKRTHPVGRLIIGIFNSIRDDEQKRQTLHHWVCSIRFLIEEKVLPTKASEYIETNGGVSSLYKMYAARKRGESSPDTEHISRTQKRCQPYKLKGTMIEQDAITTLKNLQACGKQAMINIKAEISDSGVITITNVTSMQ